MLVVVPLSALTDHTLKAPELLSGLITTRPSVRLAPHASPSPWALRQLLFVLPTYNLCHGIVRQTPRILLNIRKLTLTFVVRSGIVYKCWPISFLIKLIRTRQQSDIALVNQFDRPIFENNRRHYSTSNKRRYFRIINLIWITRKACLMNCYRLYQIINIYVGMCTCSKKKINFNLSPPLLILIS